MPVRQIANAVRAVDFHHVHKNKRESGHVSQLSRRFDQCTASGFMSVRFLCELYLMQGLIRNDLAVFRMISGASRLQAA